jgi:hypothetical protein
MRTLDMRGLIGRTLSHPVFSLGSTMLWGLLEFIALQWSAVRNRGHKLSA